jgi:hypothetical protein
VDQFPQIEIEFDFKSIGKCNCGGRRILRARIYGNELGSWVVTCSECGYRFQMPADVKYKKYEKQAMNKFKKITLADLSGISGQKLKG